MSDSEESSSELSEEFRPFDESEMSDSDDETKSLDLDKNYEKDNCFRIKGKLIKKTELNVLVKSKKPKDIRQLNTLVTQMVEDDNRRAFRYLLRHGYKVGVLNDKGQTAVHLIIYDECRRVLKRHNLKQPSQKGQYFGVRPKESQGVSMMLSFVGNLVNPFHRHPSIAPGDLLYTMIQVWLVNEPLNLNYTDCYGLTYLHAACLAGEKLLVNRCIAAGVDVNSHFYHPEFIYQNYTPLHFAVINIMLDTSNIVKILLKHGADANAKDSLGRTPLHLACRLYRYSSDLQFCDKEYQSWDSKDLAPVIIENPQNVYTKCSRFVYTFIKYHGDVNARDNLGNTPLHSIFPENYGDELISRYRVEWHGYSVPIEETAVKFAYLVNAGADVTAKNNNGDTILHLITKNLKAWRGSSYYIDVEFDDSFHTEMTKKVLSLNSEIDVNLANNFGQTPLQLAVECMSFDVVKVLLDHGADLNNLIFKTELFHYLKIAPSFDAVRNVIFIIESFKNAGFDLTPETNMKVLRFLLHDTNDCECLRNDWRHGIVYGSDSHFKTIFRRYVNLIEDGHDMNDLLIHAKIIDVFDLYMNRRLLNLIKKVTNLDHIDIEEPLFDRVHSELEIVKTTSVKDDISMYDIISNHPYNIPECIYRNFDSKPMENFKYFGGITLGHMTKAILRSFVVKTSGSCIKLLCPFLPELCCQIIGEHLSNKSILNVCLAVDHQDFLIPIIN